jgi:hypothetical protein
VKRSGFLPRLLKEGRSELSVEVLSNTRLWHEAGVRDARGAKSLEAADRAAFAGSGARGAYWGLPVITDA